MPATRSNVTAFMEIVYYSLCFVYLCIVSLMHYHLGLFPRIKEITFMEFCDRYYIPRQFSREILVPMYSAVCTCKESDTLNYPASLIVGISLNYFC
jgi:hypothetical protein